MLLWLWWGYRSVGLLLVALDLLLIASLVTWLLFAVNVVVVWLGMCCTESMNMVCSSS